MRMQRLIAIFALLAIASVLAPSQSFASAVQFRAAASASASSSNVTLPPVTTITSVGNGSFESTGTWTSSITPTLPTHIAGDLLICVVEARNDATLNSPGNWSQLYSLSNSGSHRAGVFYKIAVSNNEAHPQFSQAVWPWDTTITGRCSAFRGVDPASPFDVSYAAQARNSSDVRTGSSTPVTPGVMLLFAAHYNQSRTLSMPDSGDWTEGYRDTGIGLFYMPWWATTTGTFEADLNGNNSIYTHGALIALRPIVPATVPSGGALTINTPSGTTIGDVMVASIAVTPNLAINAPNGWTSIRTTAQTSSTSNRLATYYRVVEAGVPAGHTWTFAGSHNGAVGTIASFSGVDVSDPIDDHAGQTHSSSSNARNAPSVITSRDRGMLLTIHEYASSRRWTTPSGMTEVDDIASLSVNNGSGISMATHYEYRPTAGATNTRSASPDGNADTGATQSIALKPIPMICTTGDNFTRPNGSPGSDWIVSNSGGSFGNPRIASNRLRLTDNTGNVATMATLQRLFPGAGNRIEIVFQHFAYGGNGADGIVVVLSDASVTPMPGGYGGSLGYAQNTAASPTKPGFNGGWLGVGIDEYGNFSNPTEGRINPNGGGGMIVDSVAIRGSGSGTSGYPYLTGTSGLTPGIDNASSGSAAPGHRYRIIVDHSNNTNAYVTVERNSGGGYMTLLGPYDAKSNANQAAVPLKWVLSWTGATGGNTNYHEIDNLEICATYIETTAAADHYAIQHATGGVNCQPETVTITAKNSANQMVSADGATITVTARRVAGSPGANRGDWELDTGAGTLNNGAADDGVATYTFGPDEQQVVLALRNTHPQTVNIDVIDGLGVTEGTGSGATEPGYNQNLAFASSGFRITNGANPPSPASISTQTAGVTSGTYALQAIRTDTNTGACVGSFPANTSRDIELAFQCNNPTACQSGQQVGITNNGTTTTIAANPNSGVANYTTRSLRFGANSQAPFTLVYPDVGQITLHARYNLPLGNGNPSGNYMLGSSNAFVVKPYDFEIVNVTAGGAPNPAADDAGGAPFVKAGEAFSATVRSVNAQNQPTPNYGKENPSEGVKLTSELVNGLGLVANPVLANAAAFGPFNGGEATGTTFSWNEVGIIRLTPEVADENYLGAGNVVGTPSANVGRFIPSHFSLSGGTLTNRLGAGCSPGSTFTYMDEPLRLQYSLVARNISGGTTQNYQGAFAKLNIASAAAHGFGVRDTAGGANLASRLDVLNAAGNWSSGTADADVTTAFARGAEPDGPHNDLRIGVAPVDGDGVRLASAAMNLDVDGSASHAQIGAATQIRFGRLRVFNALGSERHPLLVPMQLEYWNGRAFVVNSADNCTALPRSTITMAPDSGMAPCKTAFTDANIVFSAGKATPMLAAPTPAHGSVDLRVNLSTESGDYCPDVNAALTGTASAARSYLHGRWSGVEYDDDPVARATFGIYGAQAPKRFIYSRENY